MAICPEWPFGSKVIWSEWLFGLNGHLVRMVIWFEWPFDSNGHLVRMVIWSEVHRPVEYRLSKLGYAARSTRFALETFFKRSKM